MRKQFSKPVLFVLGTMLFSAGFAFSLLIQQPQKTNVDSQQTDKVNCEMTSVRVKGHQLTKPLLYVEKSCESADFLPIKTALSREIEQFKANGLASDVSVYFRDFEKGRWIGIHENQPYHPGSLLKLPLLLTYLKKAESNPSLMTQNFRFAPPDNISLPQQNYKSLSLIKGQQYSLQELLTYMIVHSDNNATWLLKSMLGPFEEESIYPYLGISPPVRDSSDGMLRSTAHNVSVPLRTLYNSTFLTENQSEFALSLLTQTKFAEGLLKAIPSNLKIAHKFGEWDNGSDFELHETGIVYLKNKAYLITIMTRGKSRDKLPEIIAALSQELYEFINAQEP